MNLVDSCGWLEYFADGPNADFFAGPIEDLPNLIVPTICMFEVFRTVSRQRGESEAFQRISAMSDGLVVPLDTAIAVAAAKLAGDLTLPLADSVVLATGRAMEAVVWTQDAHFKDLDGVHYVPKEE